MKKVLIIIALVTAVMLSACNNAAVNKKEVVSFSGSITENVEYTTVVEIEKQAENNETEPSSAYYSTTENAETTKATTHQTTTRKTTNANEQRTTTEKEETTTQKETTTSPPTTTQAATCTGNNNHSQACGNMGRWFDSRNEVKAYVDKEMQHWADLEENGQITREEYYQKCPSGYECWSCAYCGKWTGNFKY